MKKNVITCLFFLISLVGISQPVSRATLTTSPYGWGMRQVPPLNNLQRTFLSFHNIVDDGAAATATNTMSFTNKSGNVSMWTNDVGYVTSTIVAGYEPKLSGTGFVKSTGTVTSYDNSNYIPTSSSNTYTIGGLNGASSLLLKIGGVNKLTLTTNSLSFQSGIDLNVPSNIIGGALITTGGTSSQFLKGDGSLDGTSYPTLGSFSSTSPLFYNSSTGVFTIQPASTSQSGALSSTDWNTFNNKWSTGGNAISTNTNFIGTTTLRSLNFYTNNVLRHKTDSLGFNTWITTGLPSTGDPNKFEGIANGTLADNNYLLRSSFNFSSTANNVNYRLGAILGVMDITATHTGTLGWAVGQYGVAYNHSSGNSIVARNIGGYFIAANRSSANATTTANYAVYAQTEIESGYTENDYGIFVPAPVINTGTCNTSFGVYIATHTAAATNFPLYVAGTIGTSYFEGKIQASILAVTTLTDAIAVNSVLTFSNNKFIKQKSADGTARDLIGMDSGDNIYITGKQAASDIYINNSATKFFSIKAAGRVGIFGTAATALLHIGTNSSASSSNAPLKFETTGAVLMTTPERGAVEPSSAGALYATKTSLLRYGIGGVVADFSADAQNGTTVETDLYSYTTPTNTLVDDGEKITFTYTGKFNDATSTAQLKIYFGGTVIGNTGALTVSSIGAWVVSGYIIKTSSTTARASINVSTPGTSTANYTEQTDLTGLTFTNTNIIKITGTAAGASGGSNDITGKLGSINWLPKANN